MLNLSTGTYQDPCGQCNALCCRVYEIEKPAKPFTFKGIPIKEQNISCTHLDGNQCRIYDSRDSFGFFICSEFSCFSVGPIVLDWARKRGLNINYAVKNEGNNNSSHTDHQLIATCLNHARDYVADLLGADAFVEPLNDSQIFDIREHISYILEQIETKNPLEARLLWQDYLYPKRWYTALERAQIEERQKEALL